MGDGLKLTVVGPRTPELKKLHEKHQAWLKDLAKEGKTPEDVLSAYADKSVTNLSSIGSSNNLGKSFFKRITAGHYVFSGDGEHGNPERESMQMLLDARGDADYTLHFTYPIEEIDAGRKQDWEKEQTKEKNRQKKNPDKEVSPDGSPGEHSLRSFFDAHEDFAKKVSIVEDGQPHVIDLLDEIGF